MKICVFHGSNRKGNTDKLLEIAKNKISDKSEVEFIDFYLPKDLPEFCRGCFLCLDKGTYGGEVCPHKKYTNVISNAIEEADGIIIGCPVYALAETVQVKALFDHYACTYMNHRPRKSNFKKSALIISSCAGAGNRNTIRTIKHNFIFWGIPKIYSVGIALWVKDWAELKEEKRRKFTEKIENKSMKFFDSIKNRKEGYAPLRTRLLFRLFLKLMNSYDDGNQDKEYYRKNGWLNGKKPWN